MSKTPIYENGVLVGFRDATAGQGETPAPAAAPAATTEEGGFLDTAGTVLSEAGKAVVGGVRDGIQELGNTVQWAGSSAAMAMTGGNDIYWTERDGFEWLTPEEANKRSDVPEWMLTPLLGDGGKISLPEVAENETMVGGMARGVTQFLAGFGIVGKALKGVKAVSTAGQFAKVTSQGAATDFTFFDAHEDRFSDFLRDNLGLRDPITEFLSADENDTVFEGKLKNAIEGLGLGLAADGIIKVTKLFKSAKAVEAVEGPEAAAKVMNDGLAEIAEKEPEVLQLNLFDQTTDPNLAESAAGAGKKLAGEGKLPMKEETPATAVADPAEVTRANADAAGITAAPTKPVNTDALVEGMNREIALRRAGSEPNPNRQIEGRLFNFDYMDGDVDIKDVMNLAADDIIAAGIKDTTTFAAIQKDAVKYLSDAVDVSPEVIDASLARMAADAEKQQGLVIAGKSLMQSLAREVELLAYRIDAGDDSTELLAKFVRYNQRLVEVSANLKSVIRGAAQTTTAGRIRTTDLVTGQALNTQDILKQLDGMVSGAGGVKGVRDLAKAIKLNAGTRGGDQSLLRIAEAGSKGLWTKSMEGLSEVYINSILSGPKTHIINAVSNVLNTALLPSEKILGGAAGMNGAMMREGMIQFLGLSRAIKDSFKMAGVSLWKGRNILDPEAGILEANGITRGAIGAPNWVKNPAAKTVLDGLGEIIRVPSRFLLSSDELFKQLNYRSSLYARLTMEAADLVAAGKLTKDGAAQFVADRMKTAFNADGGARSQIDLDFAREATFTQELNRREGLGSFAAGVQDFTSRHPFMRLIIPFVRTPANIMKASLQRTPFLHKLSTQMKSDLASGDPRRIAAARGKLVTGSLIWSSAILLATEGNLTGSGPRDPATRARLMETGWRPYSYVYRKDDGSVEYIEYKRLEPFATFLGMAADITEIGGQISEQDMSELATASVLAMTQNITSKTFLQGISDVVEALNDPQRYGPSYLYNFGANMLPYAALRREMRKGTDPATRDVQSLLDAIKNTLPAYSETLPARRSWITGQPILYPTGWGSDLMSPLGEAFASANPIIGSEWKGDKVLDELARINFAFSPPTRKVEGADLTPQQYERYVELNGTIRIGRRTMYQALEHLFDREAYDIGRERAADTSDPSTNPRIKLIQKVITQYREAAKMQLMREFPEIRQQVVTRRLQESSQRRLMQGSGGAFGPIINLNQ